MAVYTKISDDDLNDFLEKYSLGQLLSFTGIAEGVENSNFLIQTSDAPYILTLYEKRVRSEDLPFFLGLMKHLQAKGVHCPCPVPQTSGILFDELVGRPAALFTFVHGIRLHQPDTKHIKQIGRLLAQLHTTTSDFTMNRPNALSLPAWHSLFENCGEELENISTGLYSEISQTLKKLDDNWPSQLPEGIIHADLFDDNAHFLGDELSGVIDFYFACNDSFAYDVAICLNAWCFESDYSFNVTKARSLLKGYNEIRTMHVSELEAIPILAEGAALRFLLTRAYDWITVADTALVTKKDPMEYLRKMRFHASCVSAQSYGI